MKHIKIFLVTVNMLLPFVTDAIPVVTIKSPVKNSNLTNGVATVAGIANDTLPITAVYYQLNGSQWTVAAGTTNWNVAGLTLTPGSNNFRVYAVDADAHVSLTNTLSFIYVVNAPLAVGTTSFGTVKPDYNGASLQIGKAYTMTAKAAKGFAFVNWTGGTNTTSSKLTFVMKSNLTFTANFLDITRPLLVITYPAVKHSVTNALATVTGRASDNVGVADVFYSLNGSNWTEASTGNNWTNWTANIELIAGTNVIRAYATDNSGNKSITNSVSFVSTSIQIMSLSTNSDLPFSTLTITGKGFNTNLTLSVQFFNQQGYSVDVPVMNAGATSVSVLVPPFIDPLSQDFTNGMVNLRIIQSFGTVMQESYSVSGFSIGNMPVLTMPPGTVTADWAGFMELFLSSVETNLATAEAYSGGQVATGNVQARLENVRTNFGQLKILVRDAIKNTNQVSTIGIYDGIPITLNQITLRQSDQLIVAMAQQIMKSIQTNQNQPLSPSMAFASSCSLNTIQLFQALINSPNSEDELNSDYTYNLQQCASFYQGWAKDWGNYSVAFDALAFTPLTEVGTPMAVVTTVLQLASLGVASQLYTVASSLQSGDRTVLLQSQAAWDETLNGSKCAISSQLLGAVTMTPQSGIIFDLVTDHYNLCGTDIPIFLNQADEFVSPHFDLSITIAGTGSGTVAINPPGSTYTNLQQVTLTAHPATGSTFAGWSGDASGSSLSTQITMTANKSVTATFNNPNVWTGTWVGTWSETGTFGDQVDSTITWVLNQSSSKVSGTFVQVITYSDLGDPPGTTYTDTLLNGQITGNSLTIQSGGGDTFTGTISGKTINGTGGDSLFDGPFTVQKN